MSAERSENRWLIQGDTYKHREKLKALGGIWDTQMKGWRMPADTYDEARLIVDNNEGQLSFGGED